MSVPTVPLAGVIGQNVGYSKSPRLHTYWLRKYGIRGHYIPMDVATTDLPHVLNILPKMGFNGVNVTIPHKEPVLDFADVISDRAALIGAANTLTFQSDGKLYAALVGRRGLLWRLCCRNACRKSSLPTAPVLGLMRLRRISGRKSPLLTGPKPRAISKGWLRW